MLARSRASYVSSAVRRKPANATFIAVSKFRELICFVQEACREIEDIGGDVINANYSFERGATFFFSVFL